MKVHAIDAEGKAWHKDLPYYMVDRDIWREPVREAFVARYDPSDLNLRLPSYSVREWRRYGRTYAGLPIMVDTAGPWEVKEVYAVDICTHHPEARERSESLVRAKARQFCDDFGEWRPIDECLVVRPFSLAQELTEVEYRMLVQVRKR